MVFDLSQSSVSKTIAICDNDNDDDISKNKNTADIEIDISPGATFLACVYESKWWIGIVKQKSDEFDDYFISFMSPSGRAQKYIWPEKEDTCWIDKTNIICSISSPAATSSSTRGYSFTNEDLQRAEHLFKQKQK